MTLDELIDSFREDTDDRGDLAGEGTLWSDEVVARFLAEAEEEAAIRKRLLFDDTITVAVLANVSAYQFTKLFEITRATLYRQTVAANPLATPPVVAQYSPRGEGLYIIDREEMDRRFCDWRDWRYDNGCPEWLIQEDTRIVLPGRVDRAYLLRLEGYRTPLKPLSLEDTDAQPEIAPVHHRFLVHWAQHRAYSKPDSEVFNPQKSATALAAFEQYFGLRPDADLNKRNQADRPHHNVAYW